jgi:hypothetical protein
VVVTITWSPELSPETIRVRLVPLSPTTTCRLVVFPFLTNDTVLSAPVPVIASLGRLTPLAWALTIDAEALIPGITFESLWVTVRVTS